ncbi:integrin subunit alpha inflated isoform X2 [Haematobia irritans]|uniref:integrin subunit alpha inflated isoform X2 n=1 Tax=Haematobia irritans TaxID=7368 RepID=UPI003F5006E2
MKRLFQATTRQRSLPAARHSNNYYITKTTSGWMILLAICCSMLVWPLATAYNVDIPTYVIHQRPEHSTMFGFSIALHKGSYQNSLVVGAPKFDTSSYQEGVKEAGAVFNCGMDDDQCSLIRFDSSSNNRNTQGDVIDRKSNQWLGATVATSRDSDLIVACAPRYVFHTITPKKNLRWDPIGTCFTTRNFTHFKEVSPCRTNNWGYHRQGYCQAGFSAAATSNGDRLYIGAPGSWYWQGQTYSNDVTRPENQVYSTAESSSSDDDSYLGYSMVSGHFNGDGIEDVAIGMPRGAGLLGKIVVNQWNMVNIFNITGRQIGEYFGYALATSDVDGDGFDDLIIGAPMYSEHGNAEGKYDVGRVYILLQKRGAERWSVEHIRDGYNSKGRFGLALTTLGDINRDGYGDFAVGAPYDGAFGRGAVYIFHGSANGPLQKPSQIIRAEDIVGVAPYPSTFGFALSGGIDMDDNTYPDLAVGAYSSAQVFIFKSRPVAAVDASTYFSSPSKLINLEDKACISRRDKRPVPCTNLTTCWSYMGDYLPSRLNFTVSWVLDAKKTKNPRMFFMSNLNSMRTMLITLNFGKQFCHTETVYIDNVEDKLTPLEVETRYNLTSNMDPAPLVRRRRAALEPVIDQNREIVQRDTINIQKNCGPDNICVPDLKLEIKTVDKYLSGSLEPLTIDVFIANNNEDAFEAAFYLVMPKDLDYMKMEKIADTNDASITCTAPSNDNHYTLKCDIGNPLPAKKVANFRVFMMPSMKRGMSPSYEFYMEANSTNAENEGSTLDNIISKNISIWVETDLAIDGASLPDFDLYKASDYKSVENATKEEDLGPQVVHLYNFFNNGPSEIVEAVMFIHYPYQTVAGDTLMYMTNQPEVSGNIVCDPHVGVNPMNLQLDQNLVRKSYLAERGAVGKSSAWGYVEKSYGNAGGAQGVTIGQGKKLSEEEKTRLEKEDDQVESGDGSRIHTMRANEAANAQIGGGRWQWNWNSTTTTDNDGHVTTVTMRNGSTVNYGDGRLPQGAYSGGQQHYGNYYQQQGGNAQGQNMGSQQYGSYQQQGGSGNVNVQQGNQNAANIQGQNMGAHNVRQHIQMATPPRGEGHYQSTHYVSGQPQRTSYTYSSSGGSYPQQQQQQVHHQQQQYGVGAGGAGYNEFSQGGGADFGKIAAGGGGFRTNTMDLGTLNRGNVDDEIRGRSNPAQGGGYSYHYSSSGSPQTHTIYQQSSGSPQTHNTYQQSSHSSGTPQTQSSYHQSYHSSSGSPQTHASYQQSSSNFDNKPYYGTDYYDDLSDPIQLQNSPSGPHSRTRRDEPEEIGLSSPCRATKCETLRCVARNLKKGDGVWVAIRTRMVAKTMEKIAGSVPLNISTMAVSHVTKLPNIGTPTDDIIRTHEIYYKAVPEPTPVPDVVPLWVVVLAACVGALILLLLIFLLYKCGFFNRNRPADHTMERQPLRNGYHGDEHL